MSEESEKPAKRKPLRLQDPLHPRCMAILRWLEGRGGEAAVTTHIMAAETGIHRQAVMRFTRWLELYGAIHVDRRTGGVFGEGRNPNRYVQLMSVADYTAKGPDIREVIRAKLRPKRKGIAFPRNVSAVHPDEMALIREQARAEVMASIAAHAPLPPLKDDPMPYDEVEAWGVAFNE